MATEYVFLMAVVNAYEGQIMKIVDVSGAFMQADQDDLVHVQFTGAMGTSCWRLIRKYIYHM